MTIRERILWRLGWRYWSWIMVDGNVTEGWAGRIISCDDPTSVHWLGHELRRPPKRLGRFEDTP
jgi:hypothetical protein